MIFEILHKQMTYHKVNLHLSDGQRRKLYNGDRIQIHRKHVGKGKLYHLTTMQMKKLKNHMSKGTGMRFHMSKAQVTHNVRHGTGFFDFIRDVGKAALSGAKQLAKAHGEKVLDYAISKIPTENEEIKKAVKTLTNPLLKRATGGRVMIGGSFHTFGGHGVY